MLILPLFSFLGTGCNPSASINTEGEIATVRAVEKAFNQMTSTDGIQEAFLHFADDEAVIVRNDSIIKGKTAIRAFFDERAEVYNSGRLTWEPQSINISDDASMAYTYGKYTFELRDSTGSTQNFTGIFHTVWKKQANGEWRYVYD